MNNSKNIGKATHYRMPPYLYGRQGSPAEISEDQRVALYLPEPEYTPSLEELKERDPDSYRMVIYSWA